MGPDNVVPANRISFRATVIHELGHGLGFLGSGWVENGKGTFGDAGFVANEHPWVFDRFTENGDGTPLVNAAQQQHGRWASALRSNDVWFQGPATDPRVKLYAPSTWDRGSQLQPPR